MARRQTKKEKVLGVANSFVHWGDIQRIWKSNRKTFRHVVDAVVGPGVVSKKDSNRMYNVFATYFLEQALHHEKAELAHRFDMNIKVARYHDSLLRYNFWAPKRDRRRKKFVRQMHLERPLEGDEATGGNTEQQERLVASDEIFFNKCRDYLGDTLSDYLHDVMKHIKIEFLAVHYTSTKQKAWANWEWVGALYAPSGGVVGGRPSPKPTKQKDDIGTSTAEAVREEESPEQGTSGDYDTQGVI
jgi:hypothetical protein